MVRFLTNRTESRTQERSQTVNGNRLAAFFSSPTVAKYTGSKLNVTISQMPLDALITVRVIRLVVHFLQDH
jgi:hypothetical protein